MPTAHYNSVVYLNGEFQPRDAARLGVEDRGTLFADGVYEVVRYMNARPFEMDRHIQRLRRSLSGISLAYDVAEIAAISDELIQRNGITDGKTYIQITRGEAVRSHRFPRREKPTLLMLAYATDPVEKPGDVAVKTAITTEDTRWANCWIKSLMLLPNTLAQNRAVAAGCDEAIFIRDGEVTESCAGNVFIVRKGALITHPADRAILDGITRQVIIEQAGMLGIPVRVRPFSTEWLYAADEVFVTSTTTHVSALKAIDEHIIGNARAGEKTIALHKAFIKRMQAACTHG